jgi:hypothetical protein
MELAFVLIAGFWSLSPKAHEKNIYERYTCRGARSSDLSLLRIFSQVLRADAIHPHPFRSQTAALPRRRPTMLSEPKPRITRDSEVFDASGAQRHVRRHFLDCEREKTHLPGESTFYRLHAMFKPLPAAEHFESGNRHSAHSQPDSGAPELTQHRPFLDLRNSRCPQSRMIARVQPALAFS